MYSYTPKVVYSQCGQNFHRGGERGEGDAVGLPPPTALHLNFSCVRSSGPAQKYPTARPGNSMVWGAWRMAVFPSYVRTRSSTMAEMPPGGRRTPTVDRTPISYASPPGDIHLLHLRHIPHWKNPSPFLAREWPYGIRPEYNPASTDRLLSI
jgi:hypothetical protein